MTFAPFTHPQLTTGPFVMHQVWHDLLFMHWPVAVAALERLLPAPLTVDTFDGSAWVAVVPFHMSGVRGRGLPPVPLTHSMPELNVRTYVTVDGVPGVWFFSLDAGNALAVEAARVLYRLPYLRAEFTVRHHADAVVYGMDRTDHRAAPALFAARYMPTAPAFKSEPGSLEAFLTERYFLFAANQRGALYQAEIWHEPWPLQPAQAEVQHNTLLASHGIATPDVPPLLHYARRVDVLAGRLELVRTAR